IIPRIGREHIGTYTCLVSSVAGSDEISIDVSVASPPETSTGSNDNGPRIIISRVNRPASLHCQVDAFPPPEFEWYKENVPLQELERKYSFNHDGSVLNVMKTTAEDAGNYSCIAVNSAGATTLGRGC
ncbi:Tyrosine-protein kinase receptor ver-3, partial [Armadillidium nasatum]